MFEKVQIRQYIRHCEEDKAVSYLLRVTAGLESMVLGEDQILGLVKDALDFSRTMGFSKKELNKVVRDAVTCAKKVKTTFKMSEKPVSFTCPRIWSSPSTMDSRPAVTRNR